MLEKIFNILNHSNLINVNIENSNILDYSELGLLELNVYQEVPNVTFVEQDTNTIITLRKIYLLYQLQIKRQFIIQQ